MDTFREVYHPPIHPMPGPDKWPKENDDTILPSKVKRQPSRPRVTKRRAPNEPNGTYKVTRQGYDHACGKCKVINHNARTCPKKVPTSFREKLSSIYLYVLIMSLLHI